MALSKPRRITVDGKLYHWKVSKNGGLHLVVVDPEARKRNRKIVINYEENWIIRPYHVKTIIKQAEREGWTGEIRRQEGVSHEEG